MFDQDGGGSISAAEIKEILKYGDENISDEVINNIMKQIDENGDGEISFEEFQQMMQVNIE